MVGRNITIRRIDAESVDAFRRIRLEALSAEPASYASSYEDWAAFSAEEWKQRLSEPVFVAFENNEPVGLIGLLRQRPRKMVHRATIVMVYVRKGLRGGGLARNLFQVVTDYARYCGIRQLELVVSAENLAAIRFYQREGFVAAGRIPNGFFQDGREIDEIIMVCRLIR
ncbi:GNAT family N-acetyltransferase [Rhizobium lusitanum]|uniref:GNAT family N-acetyltransferase n=1 Tax=Rhizobium lusitanum TaxID=293958 RepID=A0A6L9UH79_9HYPH|nr:GNAT family N-acetyltransferase [Rhizobium lusitanum]NEI73968.1 GNAT family N-acetyltransferase [Rhizobium lusitanum]